MTPILVSSSARNYLFQPHPARNYLFKVSNVSTRTRCESCSILRRFYTRRNVSRMSWRHHFFMLLHMRKSFVYWHFPEMSILLKSRNHFNFSTPNKCRFLFKPIIFVYSCKQSELLYNMAYSQSTIKWLRTSTWTTMKYQKSF